MKVIGLWMLASVISAVALTYFALESSGVVEVTTWDNTTSAPRRTHVWFVVEGENIWLEAGHPDNPWVKDLPDTPAMAVRGGGISGEYQFTIVEGLTAHQEIRQKMRAKYGWRDVWISCLFDVEKSRMIQLKRT